MTSRELRRKREAVTEIVRLFNQLHVDGSGSDDDWLAYYNGLEKLRKETIIPLATEVGAPKTIGTGVFAFMNRDLRPIPERCTVVEAYSTELIFGINAALGNEATIEACQLAKRSCLYAAIAAVASVVAAGIALAALLLN